MTRVTKLAKGIAALGLLAGLLGGVPWALCRYVGWPLPHRLPSWSQFMTALSSQGIPDEVLLKALACVVWITWAVLVASLLVEVSAAVRGRASRHLRFAGPLQPLVGHLLAAIVVGLLAVAPRSGGSTAPRPLAAAVGVRYRPPVPVALVADTEPAASPPSTNGGSPKPAPSLRTYVVQRNDTIWGIAERELGNPLRWKEIYELNKGRPEPGGRVLDDPQWIYAGWTLLLPGQGHVAAPRPPRHEAPPPIHRLPATRTPRRVAPPPPTSACPPTRAPTGHPHAGNGRRAPAANQGPHVANGGQQPRVSLPSGSVVAGSFAAGVFAAVALGRLRRRHGYRPSAPEAGRSLGPPPLRATVRHLVSAASRGDESGESASVAEKPVLVLAGDDPERREQPDLIEIGTRQGEAVDFAITGLGSVALAGLGADEVVRAWVTATLVRAGPVAAELAITAAALERLAPGVGAMPGIRVVADNEALLRVIEAEMIARARRLDRAELPDALAYRRAHPEDPFPSLVAVTDAVAPNSAPRWRASLTRANRLGLCVIFPAETEVAAVQVLYEEGPGVKVRVVAPGARAVVDIEGPSPRSSSALPGKRCSCIASLSASRHA